MTQSRKVRVALDAMGGDFAPEEIIKGAVLATQENDVEVILTGPGDVLKRELGKYQFSHNLPIRCVEAKEVISEDEPPASAVRRKLGSSIVMAAKLVKSGEADALVSAGPSGAVAVSAIQYIGMVEGIERPAVGGNLGSFAPDIVIMDMGVNVDCKPQHLLAFAIEGCVFAEKLLNISDPTVALLSTGVEESKGNEAVREAYSLLRSGNLNFIGKIEGNEILSGRANVIVCDGFVGNVLLKFYESIGDCAKTYVKRRLRFPPLRAVAGLLFNSLFPVTKISYEGEEEGAGILWGIDGVVRLAHGSCKAPHIAHAIASAKKVFEADIVAALKSRLAKFKNEGKL
jgi:glycerol-3-phosphate acyltransferase PlsX